MYQYYTTDNQLIYLHYITNNQLIYLYYTTDNQPIYLHYIKSYTSGCSYQHHGGIYLIVIIYDTQHSRVNQDAGQNPQHENGDKGSQDFCGWFHHNKIYINQPWRVLTVFYINSLCFQSFRATIFSPLGQPATNQCSMAWTEIRRKRETSNI